MVSIQLCRADIDKGFAVVNKASEKIGAVLLKTAKKVFEVAVVAIKILATAALILLAPGAFLAGIAVGIILPKKVDESLETISRIWKRHTLLSCGGVILLGFYGLAFTPYMASFIRGAQLASRAALS